MHVGHTNKTTLTLTKLHPRFLSIGQMLRAECTFFIFLSDISWNELGFGDKSDQTVNHLDTSVCQQRRIRGEGPPSAATIVPCSHQHVGLGEGGWRRVITVPVRKGLERAEVFGRNNVLIYLQESVFPPISSDYVVLSMLKNLLPLYRCI